MILTTVQLLSRLPGKLAEEACPINQQAEGHGASASCGAFNFSWALIVGRVAPLPLLAFALESLQLHKFWEKAKSFSCMALTL
ncbi:hypothetical protein RHGRI_034603 [Rhododendron griersonianum]|uniref:Uncharacterized protein n=1 Tax=Rhododendron griersonianum TaxID=479676 RepID=A0AAV6I1K3_9ERIC|nr:hypothetical protein RHGRI_034603 [Rhododendron griersonianum]